MELTEAVLKVFFQSWMAFFCAQRAAKYWDEAEHWRCYNTGAYMTRLFIAVFCGLLVILGLVADAIVIYEFFK